jgi:hypothetical protein
MLSAQQETSVLVNLIKLAECTKPRMCGKSNSLLNRSFVSFYKSCINRLSLLQS